jgi:hypothetical protein
VKNYLLALLIVFVSTNFAAAQNDLPYREIPATPEQYTAATMAARLMDGLGFRFYWATEGLRPSDLTFKPTAEARTTLQTIEHIYEMSFVMVNAVNQVPNVAEPPVLSYEAMRKKTLENLKMASNKLKASNDKDLDSYNMIFKSGTRSTEFQFWNAINGPISDALWHTGQIVSFRRSSGNPFNEKANVLTGKLDK